MSRRRLAWLLAAVALAGCGGSAAESEQPVVIVSGRDDHGLVAQRTVGLSGEPDGTARAQVADGTLVAVLASRGEWIRVRTLEGPSQTGWVNDYYLRGTAHVVANDPRCPVPALERPGWRATGAFEPSAQVELREARSEGGRTWVLVRSLESRRQGWVAREAVSELPARLAHGHEKRACG